MILYSHTGDSLGVHKYSDYNVNWSPVYLATSWYFYKHDSATGYDTSKIDLDVCRKRAKEMKKGGIHETTGPLVLDIEAFNFGEGNWEYAQKQLISAIEIYREELPHLRMGFYGVMPRRDYWNPVLYRNNPANEIYKDNYKKWKKHNTLFRSERRDSLSYKSYQGLADYVDFISPSLYTFYSDIPGQLLYMEENIKEARRYNKPIIPWLWTSYHDSNSALKYTYLGSYYMQQQFDLVKEMEVEGVILLNWNVSDTPQEFFEVLSSL